MQHLGEAREPAVVGAEVRKEIRETSQTLGFLIDKEIKQLERLYNMITAERALALRAAEQAAVLKAIEKHVPDRQMQYAIRREIAAQFEAMARRAAPIEIPAAVPALGAGEGSEPESS